MGLKHTHDDGGTGRPTFEQLGFDYLDQDFVSIMSYKDNTSWNSLNWDPATPMAADVIALQYLYGKNERTNAGNSVHQVQRTGMFHTIWDASGNDTIDLSLSNEGWNLVLPSDQLDPTRGAWSEVDARIGYANPISEMSASTPTEFVWLLGGYEHVIGSDYADQITANFYFDESGQVPKTIVRSKGNDYISGGFYATYFDNTVVYQGKLADYTVTGIDYDPGRMDPGKVIVSGPNGTDVLESIQKVKFSDFSLGFGHHSRVGQIYRYVKAAFGPNVSADEIGRWLEVDAKMESPYLTSLEILASNTFHQKYGDGQSNESYTREFFKNLRGREITQTELNDHLQLINGYGLPTLFSNLTGWSTDLYLTGNEYEDGVKFLDALVGININDNLGSSDTYMTSPLNSGHFKTREFRRY